MARTDYDEVSKRTSVNDADELLRECRICKEIKYLKEFYPNKRYSMGYTHECRICVSAYYKKRNTPEKNKKDFLKRKYDLTVEEYDEMVKNQEGKCLICKTIPDKLCIDHDHNTDTIRGLLCDGCNRGLGDFRESIESLNNAIDYLKKNSQ
jgi:hypothetical protein